MWTLGLAVVFESYSSCAGKLMDECMAWVSNRGKNVAQRGPVRGAEGVLGAHGRVASAAFLRTRCLGSRRG